MTRLIDADAFVTEHRKIYCENCERRKNSKGKFVYEVGGVPCRACNIGDMIDDVDIAQEIISVRCDLHCNSCYGAYEVLHHEPTEEMQLEIKKRLAEKLLPAIMDEMIVIRCHYPAGERDPDDSRESWTYAVKIMICRAFGEPDIDREDKSFDERGPTAMIKAIGIAIQEQHDGEPGEVLKLV